MKSHITAMAVFVWGASLVAAAPAQAERPLRQVVPHELDHFIGSAVKGKAFAHVGIVSAVDTASGTVAVVGRHGELATLDVSSLQRDGWDLRAPTITYADVVHASNSGRNDIPIGRGTIEITAQAQQRGAPARR